MKQKPISWKKDLSIPLPPMEGYQAEFVRDFEEWYIHRRAGSKAYQLSSVEQSLMVVRKFMAHTGKPPWMWNVRDWDWCWGHLIQEEELARSTIRNYQIAIKGFLEFCESCPLNLELEAKCSEKVTNFITPDMLIVHSDDRGEGSAIPCVSREHLAQFSVHLLDLADKHEKAGRFQLGILIRRDLALTNYLYRFGLRIGEGIGTNLESFQSNKSYPQFGAYGYVHVLGKGHHGSGPIPRLIPTLAKQTSDDLSAYVTDIRSELTKSDDLTALFLSTHEERLSAQEYRTRFHQYWEELGLAKFKYRPHSLRHASITHMLQDDYALIFVQKFHGHLLPSTTAKYIHLDSHYTRLEAKKIIDIQLDHLDAVAA
jgi:integrase/recombinase XerC